MAVNQLEPVAAPGTPAPGQPAAPAQKPNALFEKAGGDWDKAGQSYFNAVSKIGELHSAVEQRDGAIAQLQRQVAALAGVGLPGAAEPDPLQRLNTEFGIPIEPFAQAIDQRASSKVEEVLTKLLGPIVRDMEANEQLASQVENFDVLKSGARKYMNAPENKEVLDTFNALRQVNPAAAWKYAIQSSKVAEIAAAPTNPSPHLGLPGGFTPQGRAPVNPAGPSQPTRENEALDYGKKYGDMTPYTHERLKGTSVERHIQGILQSLGMTPGQNW